MPKIHGFSLVEILITLTIFIFVITAVFSIYLTGQKFYQHGEVKAELLQNGRVVLERIAREIRQAEEIVSQLPQVPDNPENPPFTEIEFQDGHTPSPYQELNSDYYYIRYYLTTSTDELYRQYRVYCFDLCASCENYFRWNDSQIQGEEIIYTHACDLEERLIGEYLTDLQFWGAEIINISLILSKDQKDIQLETKIFGRNL